MIHIKEFIISREEPTDTTVGWLKPIKDGKYSIYFYGSKGWCSVVDETSGGGGSGGGIENIETNATSPLNLEATISGILATITGSVDIASQNGYGTVRCVDMDFDTFWSSSTTKFSVQTFEKNWCKSGTRGITGGLNPQCFYQVYQINDDSASGYLGLAVGLPYPAPENIVTIDNINDVEYVLCITSEGYLRRVPVSLFTQE